MEFRLQGSMVLKSGHWHLNGPNPEEIVERRNLVDSSSLRGVASFTK